MLLIGLALLAALLFALSEVLKDSPTYRNVEWNDRYLLVGWYAAWLVGGIAFLGSYWYCIDTYGYLLGFGLGWLPSGILAGITWWVTRYVWPVFALGLVGAVVALAHASGT